MAGPVKLKPVPAAAGAACPNAAVAAGLAAAAAVKPVDAPRPVPRENPVDPPSPPVPDCVVVVVAPAPKLRPPGVALKQQLAALEMCFCTTKHPLQHYSSTIYNL